jgi:multidrug transporter EmrE-like cation transporter
MNGQAHDALLLALASAAFSIGGVCMKWSAGLTRFRAAACMFALFCTGAALQAVAMRRSELGVAYIMVLGGEVVLTVAFSAAVFGEAWSPARVGAASLVVLGMIWLQRT